MNDIREEIVCQLPYYMYKIIIIRMNSMQDHECNT